MSAPEAVVSRRLVDATTSLGAGPIVSRLDGTRHADAASLLDRMGWDGGASPLRPGDPRAVAFLGRVSHHLLRGAARSHPELVALGYFLRPTELERLLADRAGRTAPDTVVVPRGLVFHVPPANVDTIFVYSWALSLLAGNANVVRLSDRTDGAAARALVDAVRLAAAEADPVVARTQALVGYGHDDAVTAALSEACDVRVLWGGDAAVHRLRGFPLAPGARELTFPDRFSLAVIGAAGYLALDADGRDRLAAGLFNDAYWFDQAACASPRLVVLVGDDAACAATDADLWLRLAATVDRRAYRVETGTAIDKRVATVGLALDGLACAVRWCSNEVVVVDVGAAGFSRVHAGAGTFQVLRLPTLDALVPLLGRRDQTLTHAGLGADELTGLARLLNGRGVDRMVPVGQALTFAAVWDGEDLFEAFVRRVTVRPA